MRKVLCAIAVAIPVAVITQAPADSVSPRAKQLHDRAIVVDSHDDTTQRLIVDTAFDIGKRNPNGNIDIPRMRERGLDALFFSIWVPSDVTGPTAVKRALDQIDAVREAVRTHPHDLMLATTAADVRKAAADHKIAALMGMEGGHMIDDDLRLLRVYAALGVRYVTLTHYKNSNWADSSTDKAAHNGLTTFGKDVVREMNRLGVIFDISHVADKTFFDAIETTRAPNDRVALVQPRHREPRAEHDRRYKIAVSDRNATQEWKDRSNMVYEIAYFHTRGYIHNELMRGGVTSADARRSAATVGAPRVGAQEQKASSAMLACFGSTSRSWCRDSVEFLERRHRTIVRKPQIVKRRTAK